MTNKEQNRPNTLIHWLYCLVIALACCQSATAEFGENALLSVDQAFMFQARSLENKDLEFYWQIAPGYFLYQDQFKLINADNDSLITPKLLPPGIDNKDRILGDTILYSTRLVFTVPWNDNFSDNSLILTYQGCAQSGFCYAPVNKHIHINANHKIDVLDTSLQQFPVSNIESLAATIKHKLLPVTMLIFFGLGILLSFSPCVLPMIPLVVNLIIGNEVGSKHKALILSSSYVAGMAGTYAIAGTLVGIVGASLQVWLQKPLILISFSGLLIITATHQLGIIHIKLPHFNRKLHHFGQRQSSGSMVGSFILGAISALIVSPCITPPLIGVLTYIWQNGNPIIGGLILFSLGLGMGVPLIIVALLSSAILPIAGAWMNLIKTASGIALLGLALWLLQGVMPADFSFKIFNNPTSKNISTNWKNINNTTELEKYLAIAKIKEQPTILEFYAAWCASCRKIELGIFTNEEIQHNLAKYMLLRVDLTNMAEQKNDLAKKLQVFGPPTILFFNSKGEEQKNKRIVGSVDLESMLKLVSN